MSHEIYMQRALELAILGLGRVSPNPMVGCVIVHNEKIIGEGYHRQYGGPHAEPNAIDAVKDKNLLSGSTLYVTLETCSHFGKTPPCADLIISFKIPRVVICTFDPNPLVAGKGIDKLKKAGIEVITGIMENSGKILNRSFITFHQKHRPYIILKWAQTADGFLARENFDSKWISNEFSRKLVHKWRTEEDAVMVGFNTALHDNPSLNVRDAVGRNPVRIVLDNKLAIPLTHHLFDQSQPTIVFNSLKNEQIQNIEYIQLPSLRPTVLLEALYKRKILSVIIEGGTKLFGTFVEAGLWDEARVFKSPKLFRNGIKAPELNHPVSAKEIIFDDELEWYHHNKPADNIREEI